MLAKAVRVVGIPDDRSTAQVCLAFWGNMRFHYLANKINITLICLIKPFQGFSQNVDVEIRYSDIIYPFRNMSMLIKIFSLTLYLVPADDLLTPFSL